MNQQGEWRSLRRKNYYVKQNRWQNLKEKAWKEFKDTIWKYEIKHEQQMNAGD